MVDRLGRRANEAQSALDRALGPALSYVERAAFFAIPVETTAGGGEKGS